LEILKWVGIVFVAGFVGYFGRYLGMLLIEKMHRRKLAPAVTTESAKETPVSRDAALEASRLKLEKKRAKAEAKRAKKEKKK
ncbi:hypothetical protein ACFLUZ_05515, partial [Chloroflexota bacterium]